MDSVLEAVDGKKGKKSSRSRRRSSDKDKPIIPGAETFEDLEAYLKKKKSQKLEELKKNRLHHE